MNPTHASYSREFDGLWSGNFNILMQAVNDKMTTMQQYVRPCS